MKPSRIRLLLLLATCYGCAAGAVYTLHAFGCALAAVPFPSPPLEERARERRPLFSAVTSGALVWQLTGRSLRSEASKLIAGLLSPTLSSKGGEGVTPRLRRLDGRKVQDGVVSASNVPTGMVAISGGVFRPLFGSPTDSREVPVPGFCLDARPVINDDFLDFIRANPGWQRSRVKRLFADEWYLKNWAGDLALGTNAPPGAPVTFVSWFAARAYAQWKGKRLPTIAEWELAAAASTKGPDGKNDPEFQRQLRAWYASPSGKLANAGAGQPNYWGAYDLHGLVWEWVSDFNTAMVTGDARADSELDRQLFCGSGAIGARDVTDYAAFMRYGFRSSLKADYCIHNLGFRCAKGL